MGSDEESGIYEIAVPELEPLEEEAGGGELELPGLEPQDGGDASIVKAGWGGKGWIELPLIQIL